MDTIKNLAKAFVGESQARNRYTFYAKVAKKEGLEQISEIFLITAENEKEHAKRIFEHLIELKKDNEKIIVDTDVPFVLGTTIENLKSAISGENYEHMKMYPEFADVAEKENLSDIAERLRSIAKAEEHHEERFKKLLKELEGGTLFKKDSEIMWVCRECGYVHSGKEPPEKCPSCDHEKGFYQRKCEEY